MCFGLCTVKLILAETDNWGKKNTCYDLIIHEKCVFTLRCDKYYI